MTGTSLLAYGLCAVCIFFCVILLFGEMASVRSGSGKSFAGSFWGYLFLAFVFAIMGDWLW